MIKFEKINPGMTLYDVHRYKLAHVKMSRLGSWTVFIHKVDHEHRRAMCSWNHNAPTWWTERSLSKLYVKITPSIQARLRR